MGLPGTVDNLTVEQFRNLLKTYEVVTDRKLRDNLYKFLNEISPVCDRLGMKMAIHPDDPPRPIFGLPRIMSTAADFREMCEKVPSKNIGFTFCTGSLGADQHNDLVKMVEKYVKMGRIHFMHIRNIKLIDGGFEETAHDQNYGSMDIIGIIKVLAENNYQGYCRPDHGRMIWDEVAMPGYGLYDRALGATYLNGLWEAIVKSCS